MLHETAVAWFRNRMRREPPVVVPWLETTELWRQRAQKVVKRINRECEVARVCRKLPQRLQELLDAEGDRLPY